MITELYFIPLIGYWSLICEKNVESTMISLYTGLFGASSVFGDIFGGIIQQSMEINERDFSKAWILILMQIFYVSLVCIGFLFTEKNFVIVK